MQELNSQITNRFWLPSASIDVLKKRADILSTIRQFFSERKVMEVDTPSLSQSTVTDPYLDSFTTQYSLATQALYLQTSPEFHMKRLLAAGSGAIYQICKAFRHEEFARYHNPEFTILEWYRPGFDHFALMQEVDALVTMILNCPSAEKISYQTVFKQHLQIDPLTIDLQALKELSEMHDLGAWLQKEDKDTLLQVLFSEIIEPQIGLQRPCFIYHFPASQASLAQLHSQDRRVAERFELYYQGIELVNGFHELSDPIEQQRRFEQDNLKRSQLGYQQNKIDPHLLQALSAGLPDCSGVALGIDRLLMLALNCKHIDEVIAFPVDRA